MLSAASSSSPRKSSRNEITTLTSGGLLAEPRDPDQARLESLRADPADQMAEASQELCASHRTLKREHLLELIEDENRRQQHIVAPEFNRLEVVPRRCRVPRVVFDVLSCGLAVDGLVEADEQRTADIVSRTSNGRQCSSRSGPASPAWSNDVFPSPDFA